MAMGPAWDLSAQQAWDSRWRAGRHETFVVASRDFWRTQQQTVVGFFIALRRVGSQGFLVARHVDVCISAARMAIDCVISRHYSDAIDPMLSRERWHVLLFFIDRGRPILCAGSDVRFVRPPAHLFAAIGGSGSAKGAMDAAIEADVYPAGFGGG